MRPWNFLCAALGLAGLAEMALAEDLRFMHFWASPGELRAVEEIRKSAARAGLTLTEAPVPGDFTDLRSAMLASVISKTPPDATQWMVGDELEILIGSEVLIGVTSDRVDFPTVLLPEIYDAVKRPGGLTSLPLGIHIENFVVFNTEAFAKVGLPVPRSWAELLDAAPALDRAGIQPLVMSSQSWQMQNLFPNILSSLLSAEDFRGYLNDTLPPETLRPQMEETFRILAGLRAYAPTPLPDIGHVAGAEMVSRGEAAAYGLGDYLVPELLPSAALFCTLSPGASVVLMGVDGMAFVNRHDAGKERLIEAFVYDFYMNGGATDYVRAKGGVSVLAADQGKAPDGSCASQSQRGWNEATAHLLLSGDAWQNHLRIVGKFTADFVADGTMPPAQAADTLLRLMGKM